MTSARYRLPAGVSCKQPADAQEQVVAQHVFQLRHLLADRALGQVQFFGGTGKTQMAGCSFKALQGGHGGYQAF